MIGEPIATSQTCFICDAGATRILKIPCAPGGKLYVCDKCADGPADDAIKRIFHAYKASRSKNITAFKQVNPNS